MGQPIAIEVRNVSKRYSDDPGLAPALDNVSVDIADNEFFTLLGPSGCGKTTLLRTIAGFEHVSEGDIRLAGEPVNDLPPFKRRVNTVFQSYALFPHMTVAQNIAFGLEMQGLDHKVIPQRVDEMLALVQMQHLARRKPAELSGGQQQRVALARALAPKPKVLLLDEPLSALDAKLREAMQVELRQLQQRLGITTIVVTHDQREAMTMADTVVVMNGGEIRQAAAPVDVYRKPADTFVADFIGMTNLIDFSADSAGRAVVLGEAVEGLALSSGLSKGVISVRPEDVELTAPGHGAISGTVTFVRDLGGTIETFVEAGGKQIVAVSTPSARPQVTVGQNVGVKLGADVCVVLKS